MSRSSEIFSLNSNSWRLVFGQLASQVCDRMTSLGLVWVLTEHYGAQVVPWFLAVSGLPHLLFSAISGRCINKWGTLKTVVWTDALRALLYLMALAVIPRLQSGDALPVFFVLVFLTNCFAAFFNPALLSLPIHVAPEGKIQKLTALVNSCMSLSVVLGPLTAVALYKVAGLPGIFIATALAYAWAALLGSRIKLPRAEVKADDNLENGSTQEIPGIWNTLSKDSLLTFMLGCFLLMNLFFGPLQIALPLYAKDIFQGGIDGLAWLEGALGVGLLAGGMMLSVVKLPGSRMQQIVTGLVGAAIAYGFFGLSKTLVSGFVATACIGFFLGICNVVILNLFQERPEPARVPVVMGMVNMIGVASIPLSMSVSGLILPVMGVVNLTQTAAVGLLLVVTFSGLKLWRQEA